MELARSSYRLRDGGAYAITDEITRRLFPAARAGRRRADRYAGAALGIVALWLYGRSKRSGDS